MATVDSRCVCGAAALSDNTFSPAPGQANAAHCPNNANDHNGHVYNPIGMFLFLFYLVLSLGIPKCVVRKKSR